MQPGDLVKGVVRLVSLPDIFIKLNRMVDDPRSSAADISDVVAQDPALTARLLRIANSPFYGFPSRIDNVPRAVTVIGTRGLRDLALATSTVDVFSRLAGDFVKMDSFWRHSLYCGISARLLGARCRLMHSEALFAAGLLHDIGQLIILNKLPEMGREAHLRAADSGTHLFSMEHEVIGFDHAEVGAELLRKWRLPIHLWEAVRWHHMPDQARRAPLEAAIIHIANSLAAHAFPLATREDGRAPVPGVANRVHEVAWRATGIKEEDLEDIHEETLGQFDSLADAFLSKVA